MTVATKAPIPFPIRLGDLDDFVHPSPSHLLARPLLTSYGHVLAGNGRIAINIHRGLWTDTDFHPPHPAARARFNSLPWGKLPHADHPEWRATDDIRSALYATAPIHPWRPDGRPAPSPVWLVADHHRVRLSHLQLIARLPRCLLYTGEALAGDPLFFTFSGGIGLIPVDTSLAAIPVSSRVFTPQRTALGDHRITATRFTGLHSHLKNWPPADLSDSPDLPEN